MVGKSIDGLEVGQKAVIVKTITAADIVYGITMPETGISRIVSVKFEDEKKKIKEVAVGV